MVVWWVCGGQSSKGKVTDICGTIFRNQSRSIQPYQFQLRPQQQAFYQQQQQQVQYCPRSFSWEDFNSHIKTMTPPSSYQQQPSLKQHFKFQQPQLQQTSQFQLRVQPQQQPQAQQPQVQSNLSKISKMATVLPLQRCPDVGQFSGSLGQLDLSSGHSSRLDNDPAIMSYSYKAAINTMASK